MREGKRQKRLKSPLQQYRNDIEEMSKKLFKCAVKICNDNLLSAKFALWGTTQIIEEKIKKGKL